VSDLGWWVALSLLTIGLVYLSVARFESRKHIPCMHHDPRLNPSGNLSGLDPVTCIRQIESGVLQCTACGMEWKRAR